MKRVDMKVLVDNDYEAEYLVVSNVDGDYDYIECDTLEEAEEELKQQYQDTMIYTTCDFPYYEDLKNVTFSEDEKETWNQMIDECSFCIVKWDDNKERWDNKHAWILEPEEEKDLGWYKR